MRVTVGDSSEVWGGLSVLPRILQPRQDGHECWRPGFLPGLPVGGTLPGGQNPFPISIYQWNITSGVSHLTHFFLTKGYFYETATACVLQCINMNEKHIYYAREIKFIGK